MKPKDALRSIMDESRAKFALPRNLITTDRILQRWAVSSGTGLPVEDHDDLPRAKPPPLPDDVAIEVDLLISRSPPRTYKLVRKWYRSPEPAEAIAASLGMSARNIYKARNICLHFMRDRFLHSDNNQLVRMVMVLEG